VLEQAQRAGRLEDELFLLIGKDGSIHLFEIQALRATGAARLHERGDTGRNGDGGLCRRDGG
jgi:hypothetical protein